MQLKDEIMFKLTTFIRNSERSYYSEFHFGWYEMDVFRLTFGVRDGI